LNDFAKVTCCRESWHEGVVSLLSNVLPYLWRELLEDLRPVVLLPFEELVLPDRESLLALEVDELGSHFILVQPNVLAKALHYQGPNIVWRDLQRYVIGVCYLRGQ